MWFPFYHLNSTRLLRAAWGHDWECPWLTVCCRKNLSWLIFKGHQKIAWEQARNNLIWIIFLCDCAKGFVVDTSIYRQLWSCLPSSWLTSGILTGFHTVSAHMVHNMFFHQSEETAGNNLLHWGENRWTWVRKNKYSMYHRENSKKITEDI